MSALRARRRGFSPLRFVGPGETLRGIDVAAPLGNFKAASYGMTDARMAAIAANGFNLIRGFFDVTELTNAVSPAAVTAAVAARVAYVGQARGPGNFFKVLLCAGGTNLEQWCDGGVKTALLADRLASLAGGMAAAFPPEVAALELLNEPPDTSPSYETVIAPALFAKARQAAPQMSIAVQPAGGWYGNFPRFNPAQFDPNTIYAFHEYSPGSFSSQSTPTNPFPHMYNVTFPISAYAGGKAQLVADVTARINADGTIVDKATEIARYVAEINGLFYAPAPLGTGPVAAGSWNAMLGWRSAHAIPRQQIMCTETGVEGAFNYVGTPAANEASRAGYMTAVVRDCRLQGFGGCVLHQALGDFNLFEQTSVGQHGEAMLTWVRDVAAG